ncbi:internal (core) protein [Enterobacter phage 02_vB_Eclo_IJM]|nr:internal (core) protein [Enterobacter phage 02_vB_Eclo_IJM]
MEEIATSDFRMPLSLTLKRLGLTRLMNTSSVVLTQTSLTAISPSTGPSISISKQSENTAMLNTRVELNSFLNDGDLMRSPEAGKSFMSYLREGLTTAAIPSDQRATEVITQTVRDAIQKSGGLNFLQQIRNERITLNGVDATVEEIVGPEVFNASWWRHKGLSTSW